MQNWWSPYLGSQGGYGMPYGLAPTPPQQSQQPQMNPWAMLGLGGFGTMTSPDDTNAVRDPSQPSQLQRRQQQQRQLQMAQMGLGMLRPRQPAHSGPYPWI